MSLTVPFGPLLSWGAFQFVAGRSLLLPGWHLQTAPAHGMALGQAFAFDRYGKTLVPVEYTLTWEYLLRCAPPDAPASLQTQMDALLGVYENSQVQILIVYKYGQQGTVQGLARLEDITEVAGSPTHKKLHLSYFVPGGLS